MTEVLVISGIAGAFLSGFFLGVFSMAALWVHQDRRAIAEGHIVISGALFTMIGRRR